MIFAPKILCLGSALQDIYLLDQDDFIPESVRKKSVLAKLELGTKVDIDDIFYFAGGGGVNSATTFARAGFSSFLLTNVGLDLPSQLIMSHCQKENISTKFIQTNPKKHTGLSVVLLDKISGERTILTHRGASLDFSNLNPNILNKLRPRWLYITTLQGDFTTLNKFIKKARTTGTKIMFNPGQKELKSPEKLLPLLKNIDILIMNHQEAALLFTNKSSLSNNSTISPADLLTKVSAYAKITIITSGKTGGLLFHRTEISPQKSSQKTKINSSKLKNPKKSTNLTKSTNSTKSLTNPTAITTPATASPASPAITNIYSFGLYKDVPVKDTTGAGDAFGSGFLAALIKTQDITKAITFASANSTSVIQHFSASNHVLSLKTAKISPMSIKLFQKSS